MTRPSRPAWSVVVPTFNRPARLSRCVAALAALRPPAGGFEIVVVNDGGVEPTDAVRAIAVAGNAASALFLSRRNSGAAAARNEGAARATGRWLAFTDDDCAPQADWLVDFEQALASSPDALVGGTVVNALRGNVFSETSQVLAAYVASWFDGADRRERFFTSNNIALSRAAFFDAGGFDAGFGRNTGEDREFCDRWHAQGRPSIREPRAIVHHSHDLTLMSFLRQHAQYGMGARSFRAVRRANGRPVRIDPGFYLGSLRYALRERPFLRGVRLAGLTAAAHGAYLAGLARATMRGGPALAPSPAPAGDETARLRAEPAAAMSTNNPAITVVLPTWDTFDAVRTTVAHLSRQTIADRIELLICAPDADRFVIDADAVAALHSARVLEAGDLTASGPARARAIRDARAEVIAFTEDHCYPDPPWAEALLRAHAEPHAAVAPAIRNANPETLVSWADVLLGYGRWLAPGRRAIVDLLPGHNVSYKRSVLLEYDADLDRLMEAETVLLWDLRRRGHTLLFEPAATTAHTNFSRLAIWLDVQWHLGRVFAATRTARWSPFRRAAYAAGSPAIPLIRLYHVVAYGRRNRVPAGRIAAALPLVAIGLAVDFAAQAAGALVGAGSSTARLAAYEFHRAEVNRTGRPPARVPG